MSTLIDTDWRPRAECLGSDPNLFFDDDRQDEAKRICDICVVRAPCLEAALAEIDTEGIRAGTNESERRRLRAQHPQPSHPACGYTAKITPATVVAAASLFFGIPEELIKSPSRSTEVVKPRHVAMYLCRRLTDFSFPAIGRFFGGRDHTTVLHAVRKVKASPELLADATQLSDRLRARTMPQEA